ncbi:Gmad2 immunoglobulin-like domain-containing protein [Nocardioides sp.]|uniref:Gmad2 immunoglobulin-like domain-containing protein n=1 Tax=Nocardioides sp. TaxID=35761 RepID=UPI001A2D37C4|nr:Gmad2 immunoglobulin-like domain-containing protein [Nocardioides sp.]MBJ7358295.1 GerMN domain-containing protein [Nocardioides sp.]
MTRLPRHRACVAASALVLSMGLAACGDEEPTAQDPGDGETSSAAGEPTDEPTGDPTDDVSATATPTDLVTVPVYFVGDTPNGPALYREFRKVEADNPMDEAVALMTAGDALDPDYRTLYPGGTFESVAFSEGAGAIVAQVEDDGWNAPGDLSKREAKLAVQQLVYTVQGIQQERLPVLVQNGSDPAPLFGVDTSGGLKAAKPLDVLAFMNVTTPEEGATVSGSFTAEGVGSSFEATVIWEVRDASGAAVLEGFTTAEGWIDKLYPWTAEVDLGGLAPGTYTFAALTDDPSDGEGGGPTEDTKTIVVQ